MTDFITCADSAVVHILFIRERFLLYLFQVNVTQELMPISWYFGCSRYVLSGVCPSFSLVLPFIVCAQYQLLDSNGALSTASINHVHVGLHNNPTAPPSPPIRAVRQRH